MSSSGIFSPAPGYLEHLFADVRKAGGLCVADEVQSGFGRTGEQMWGFQAGDVIPDIVTFGKPIAGGYPMGLVVTTREIARKFGAKHAFFSTTGGNPVACAAALAMLEVIEDEGLVENARNVGTKLATELRSLSDRHSLIGDVRGSGLFIGVELVSDRDSLQPASEETHRIVNDLRENQVLVGIDGPHHNVLKIRPPMVFSESHVDILVARLDQALSR
jgi:4-aminobutyrate aminotransferase-like enzyme